MPDYTNIEYIPLLICNECHRALCQSFTDMRKFYCGNPGCKSYLWAIRINQRLTVKAQILNEKVNIHEEA